MILLTDIELRTFSSGTEIDLLDNGPVFVEISYGEGVQNTRDKTVLPTLNARRLGPLTAVQGGWDENESFEVPPNVRALSVAVSVGDADIGENQVGRIGLDTDQLQDISLREDNRFFNTFASNIANLSISLVCIYIPDDEERPSDGAPSRAEYQRALESCTDSVARLRRIGDHFLQRCFPSNAKDEIDETIDYDVHHGDDDYADLLGSIFKRLDSKVMRNIDNAASYHERAIDLTPDGQADKPRAVRKLGNLFLKRFGLSGDMQDVKKAISLHERALQLMPDGHPGRPACSIDLGNSSLIYYVQSGNLTFMEKAISHHELANDLTPDTHAKKPTYLSNLGASMLKQFQYSGDLKDIEDAISHYELSINLTPDDHAGKPTALNNIGALLLSRFERSGDLKDIDKAISHYEHGVRLTPDDHADKPRCLGNLGNSFLSRFKHSGDLADIEKAISYHKLAVNLTPDSHANKPGYLDNLGLSLMRRFGHSGDLMDIDSAISYHKDALNLTPDSNAGKPGCLNNLGASFLSRFRYSGDLKDIETAIYYHQCAVDLTPDGHAGRPVYWNNLGESFSRRFAHSGDLEDVKTAISYHTLAVDSTPDGHARKPDYLNNLGQSFLRRFTYSGDLKDIDKAISHYGHAAHLTPDSHADKHLVLTGLGVSFSSRSQHSGDLEDIEKAISHFEQAMHLTPSGHTAMPAHLTNLGVLFSEHFEKSQDLIDINKAIHYHEQAVHLTPDEHAEKPSRLDKLGSSFLMRFEYMGELEDLDKAILYRSLAVRLTPDGHTRMPAYLNNLGNTFAKRFEHSNDAMDIDRAILNHEHAVQLTPAGHASRPHWLSNLGSSTFNRYKHAKDSADLLLSIQSYKDAATSATGTPSILFQAALWWARQSSLIDSSASLSAYKTAMSFLSRVAWLGYSVSARFGQLSSFGTVATEAASVAVSSDRQDIAFEWLEQGRSIVWRQLLNLRTPLDDLHQVDSVLADDLISTSRALENANMQNNSEGNSEGAETSLLNEEAAQAHHRLAEKWDDLLKRVQLLPGFDDFLLPKKLATLCEAAGSGPIAVINVHEFRSDALILLPDPENIAHIPLDDNLYNKAQDLHRSLDNVLQVAGRNAQGSRAGRVASFQSDDSVIANILADLWTDVVKPVLDEIAYNNPNTSDPPRIWWCPTGPLTFLPIHAAGLYNQSPPGPSLSDFAISSYIPTVTALLEATQRGSREFKGLLGVSQSNTPGLPRLINADKELALIKQFGASLNIHNLQGESATVERVLKEMEVASWVHFACHGIQDRSAPTESKFCLHDGGLTLNKIIRKSFPNADFAFLSACETATGTKKLPEESVHLAAGMLAAGYKSVIATMWSIGDDDAPIIAREVYSRLLSGPDGPDSSRAAYALHHAVKELRAQRGTSGNRALLSWIPFVHFGK